MGEDLLFAFIAGIALGCALTIVLLGVTGQLTNLNESTLKDICTNLSNGKSVDYEIRDGKLICIIPSYDHTSNILIKSNGDLG